MGKEEEINEERKRELGGFLGLISGMDSHMVPPDDAKDIQNGASYIPYEVTDLRRAGKKVKYLGDNRWEHEGRIIA